MLRTEDQEARGFCNKVRHGTCRRSLAPPPIGLALVLGLAGTPLLDTPPLGLTYKLNDPFPATPVGVFHLPVLSQDSEFIVYAAATNANGTGGSSIYASPVDGSAAPIALTGPVSVEEIQVSPDGAWVVYRVFDSNLEWSLNSVPVDGSAAPVAIASGLPLPE